jgi:hypothetical protein
MTAVWLVDAPDAHVNVQVCGAVETAPAVTTVTGQGPADVFLATDAQVSDVDEANTVVCATPLT